MNSIVHWFYICDRPDVSQRSYLAQQKSIHLGLLACFHSGSNPYLTPLLEASPSFHYEFGVHFC